MDQVNFWSRVRICTPGQELLPATPAFVKRRKEVRVLQPQSNVLFFLLVLIFIALAWWMVTTKHLVFRLLVGGHDMITWRAEVPLMLRWMTPQLARAAQREAAGQSRV